MEINFTHSQYRGCIQITATGAQAGKPCVISNWTKIRIVSEIECGHTGVVVCSYSSVYIFGNQLNISWI